MVALGLVFSVPLVFWTGSLLNADTKHFVIRSGTWTLCLLLVAGVAHSRRVSFPKSAILLLSVCSCLFAFGVGLANPGTDWLVYFDTCTILLFFLASLSLTRDESFVLLLLHFWEAAAAAVCGYYFLQLADLEPVASSVPVHSWIGSTLGNRNFMAFFLIATFPMCLYLSLRKGLFAKAYHFSTAALIATVLAISGSRTGTGILAVMLAASIGYWLRRCASVRLRRASWILSAALSVLIGLGIGWKWLREASSRGWEWDSLFHGRIGIWRDTLVLIAGSPWLGHGPGSFPRVFPSCRSTQLGYSFGFQEPVFSSHNVGLDIVAESGIIGLAIFLALVLCASGLPFIRYEVAHRQRDKVFFCGMTLVGCVGFSLTGEIFHVLFCTLFAWLSLAILYNSLSREYHVVAIPIPRGWMAAAMAFCVVPLVAIALGFSATRFAASIQVKTAREILSRGPNPESARTHLNKALALEPGNLYALYQLGYLAMWHDRPREALEYYAAIGKVAPYFESLPYNMGLAWHLLGEDRKAIESASAFLKIYPTFEDATRLIAVSYSSLGMADSALLWSGNHSCMGSPARLTAP